MKCVCVPVLALVIHLKRIGEPWKPPWSSSPMAAAEWQAAAVLASMTPSQASKRAWPERNEYSRNNNIVKKLQLVLTRWDSLE